jgi:hypothetical protein
MIFEAMSYHLKSQLPGKIFKITNDRTKNQEPRIKTNSRLRQFCHLRIIPHFFGVETRNETLTLV